MASDPRLHDLLTRWNRLREQGTTLSAEEICRDVPELKEEVLRYLKSLETVLHETPDRSPSSTEPTDGNGTLDGPPAGELLTVSRFALRDLHASGGLGEVYRGLDEELHREVALKFIRAEHLHDEVSRDRFLVEAEVTSQLDHPGVVSVLGLGRTHDDRPFYAMRFIRGETLKERNDRQHRDHGSWDFGSVAFRTVLEHLISACKTVAYAHDRGIVHCDLKPSNIMLGKYGETLVVDWGIATQVERDAEARASGEITLRAAREANDSSGTRAGTPAYMSPEQTPGSPQPVTAASDIYSLGATLYTLISGRAPFEESELQELWPRVRRGDFPPPRQLRDAVPRGLEAICLQAMATRPKERHASAMTLAADLESWLADEPVTAYRERWPERLARLMRRHRSVTRSIVGSSFVVLLVVAVAAVALWRMARHEHDLRLLAERMRGQRLQASAKLAAGTLASRIGIRWHTLQQQAASPDLHRWLAEVAPLKDPIRYGHPLQVQIQHWIDRVRDSNQSVVEATSWLVTDADGILLARTPLKNMARSVIGRSFRYRHWYHGLGQDLDPEEAERLKPDPIDDAHLSVVFRSRVNDNLMVAFTVPIRDPDAGPGGAVLGILGMTVQVADFDALKLDLGDDLDLVLADLRETRFDDVTHQGLIVHHPRLVAIGSGTYSAGQRRFTLDPVEVTAIEELQRERLLRQRAAEASNGAEGLVRHHHDPLGDPETRWLAAFEPVFVTWEDTVRQTGLVVIVQERQPSTPGELFDGG